MGLATVDPVVPSSPFTRRGFLTASAGLAAAGLLAACGDDGGSSPADAGYKPIQFFPDGNQAAEVPQRFPFGLGDSGGIVENVGDGGPGDMVATITDGKGNIVAADLAVRRHSKGLARPYWPLLTELPRGITRRSRWTAPAGAANISVAPKEAVAVPVPAAPCLSQ
jgi:hypothetical protein